MSTKKVPQSAAHAAKIELYDKLIKTNPKIERKGDTMPYTAINGNMFSYLAKDGFMALKLPGKEREAFLVKYKTTLFHQYGIIQKEYVTVPHTLLENTAALKKYL